MMKTEQTEFWQGDFGAEYTDRNVFEPEALDELYSSRYGVSRKQMTKDFLGELQLGRVLEVGCNVGNQLRHLQSTGLNNLYGIELQQYAVEKSKELTRGIQIIQGSAFDIPFKDRYFDLVYTFGVLIHISPSDIQRAMEEIYRSSGRYIYGFEYYSDSYHEISYRGHKSKMWKANFCDLYLEKFSNLKVVREQRFTYLENSNLVDQMFLLEKTSP